MRKTFVETFHSQIHEIADMVFSEVSGSAVEYDIEPEWLLMEVVHELEQHNPYGWRPMNT